MLKTFLRWAVIAVVVVFLLAQLVPYGRNHTNPAVTAEPQWDSPQTRDLAKRACFDCHSNETVWPRYSHIAPTSWLVQRDVAEARRKLNFSEWDRPQKNADEAAEEVRKGKKPLWFYVPLHPQAKLSATETRALIHGLETTIGHGETMRKESTHNEEESR